MRFKLFSALAILLLLSSLGFAGTTCATPTIVPADGRIVDFDFVAASGTNFYQASVTPGHSYSFEVRQDYDDQNTDLTVSVTSNGGTCTTAAVGLNDTTGFEPAMPANTFRQSITVPAAPAGTQNYSIKVVNANAVTGRYVSVKVTDTTIVVPLYEDFGSNCVVTPAKCTLTYFSLVNATSKPLTVTVSLYSVAGAPVGTPFVQTLKVANNFTNSMLTQSAALGAPTNSSGYALITHNGPAGAISGLAFNSSQATSPPFVQTIPVEEIRVK